MQRFICACGQRLAFENVHCLACGRRLGFVPDRLALVAVEETGDDRWLPVGATPDGPPQRPCRNYAEHDICNWLVPATSDDPLCRSCRLTVAIPDLTIDGHLARWARVEAAKRRLVYGLLALRLPFEATAAGMPALHFSFLADQPGQPIVTGHDNGHVTLSIAEADDAIRAQTRDTLGEPYRTLLGHLRHEAGHYFWTRLIVGEPRLTGFRTLFGDESADYTAALERHYRDGAPANWQDTYVSAYASAHPHEDWAETWAHYLHIQDTLDTAHAFGLRVAEAATAPLPRGDDASFERLVAAWVPLTLAVNELNRSMGQPDMYPFVLPPAALSKLAFVHEVVREAAAAQSPSSSATA